VLELMAVEGVLDLEDGGEAEVEVVEVVEVVEESTAELDDWTEEGVDFTRALADGEGEVD
jgi:hypothetical protein